MTFTDRYSVKVVVSTNGKTLCHLNVPISSVLRGLKETILNKYKKLFMKNLWVSERRCVPELIDISFKGSDLHGRDYSPLSDMGFMEGTVNQVDINFCRAKAYITQKEYTDCLARLDTATRSEYSSELIEMALNMTPTGKYEHALSNLINKTTRVFEGLLTVEKPNVIQQVKAIREQAIFPTCRARH